MNLRGIMWTLYLEAARRRYMDSIGSPERPWLRRSPAEDEAWRREYDRSRGIQPTDKAG